MARLALQQVAGQQQHVEDPEPERVGHERRPRVGALASSQYTAQDSITNPSKSLRPRYGTPAPPSSGVPAPRRRAFTSTSSATARSMTTYPSAYRSRRGRPSSPSDDLRGGAGELGVVEAGVGAVGGEQLGVGALLDDVAVPPSRGSRRRRGSSTGGGRSRSSCGWRAGAFIASWICTSVRVSTELVASSRMRMAGSARKARAIVSSCFWPALMLSPSSLMTVS